LMHLRRVRSPKQNRCKPCTDEQDGREIGEQSSCVFQAMLCKMAVRCAVNTYGRKRMSKGASARCE
jgi:hypothetical protein